MAEKELYWVYILYSEKADRRYTGMCSDVEKRLKDHNSGTNKSTKAYLPWKLIYKENYPSRLEARKREKYFKSGVGREYLDSLFKNKTYK